MTVATTPVAAGPMRDRHLGLIELARIGVSLRWQLVRNRAVRIGKRTRFAYFISAAYAIANVLGLLASRFVSDVAAERTLVLLVSSLASGWIFGPILIGGVDETVDPTKLALLPLRVRELFTIQLTAAMSGVGPLAALVSLTLGMPFGFAPLGPGLLVIIVAAVVTVVMIVAIARAVAASLAIAQRRPRWSRRGGACGGAHGGCPVRRCAVGNELLRREGRPAGGRAAVGPVGLAGAGHTCRLAE